MSDLKTIHDLRDTDHRLMPYTKEMGCGLVILNDAIVLNSYYSPEGPWAEGEKAVGKFKPAFLRVVIMVPYGHYYDEHKAFARNFYKEQLIFWNTLDGLPRADIAARILARKTHLNITGERSVHGKSIHVYPNALTLCGERVPLPANTHDEQFNLGTKKFGHAEVLYKNNKHLH
jgi:hypothetical protein